MQLLWTVTNKWSSSSGSSSGSSSAYLQQHVRATSFDLQLSHVICSCLPDCYNCNVLTLWICVKYEPVTGVNLHKYTVPSAFHQVNFSLGLIHNLQHFRNPLKNTLPSVQKCTEKSWFSWTFLMLLNTHNVCTENGHPDHLLTTVQVFHPLHNFKLIYGTKFYCYKLEI